MRRGVRPNGCIGGQKRMALDIINLMEHGFNLLKATEGGDDLW